MAKKKTEIKLNTETGVKSFPFYTAVRLLCPISKNSWVYSIAEGENFTFENCQIKDSKGKKIIEIENKNCGC